MPHPLRTDVTDFIEGLKSFERDRITTDLVHRYVDSMRLSAEALKPYIFWKDDSYTRNLIFRDSFFEVMAICWRPGQQTAIHSHNGQLGWMAVAQGDISVHNYRYVSCGSPGNQNVIGLDCLAGGSHIDLERLNTQTGTAQGPIILVDKLQTIHQIENSDKAAAGCLSIHVYSLPIDSCVSYNLDQHKCFRKTLSYYSRYGQVDIEVEAQPSAPVTLLEDKSSKAL